MSEVSGLNALRPKLKNCKFFAGETKLVIENQISKSQLVLPIDNKRIIEMFDGEKSIKEITSLLYQKYGNVSFNSIISTVQLMADADLIDGQEDLLESIKSESSEEKKPSLIIRPFFEFSVLKKIDINFSSQALFYVLSFALLAALGLNYFVPFWNYNVSDFLRFQSGYGQAVLRLVILSSALMTIKTLVKCLLMVASSGHFYQLSLRANFFSLSLNVNENSIFGESNKIALFIYGITTALGYLIAASVLGYLFPQADWINDLKILAILLTFVELDPYKQSEMTKFFHFFYAEDQIHNMTAYLKNCSLSGAISTKKAKLSDELLLIVYSILAMAWSVVFTLFSLDLLIKNFPKLFLELQTGQQFGQISAGLVMAFMTFIFGYMFLGLMHTVAKNVLFPLLVPFNTLFSSKKSIRKNKLNKVDVLDSLRKNIFFNQLTDEAIEYLYSSGQVKTLKKGLNLVVQGSTGKSVFLIIEGSVDVNVVEKTGRVKSIMTLEKDSVIGEMAMLGPCQRTSNATALDNLIVLELPSNVFLDMESNHLKADFEKMKSRLEISEFVSTANLFKEFPSEIMNVFIEAGDLVIFPEGHNIVEQGESDKTFYLLIKGEVDVVVDNQTVAHLEQGDFFGEVALIADVPRTATVKTTKECLFLYIEDKPFWKILSENIELAMYLEVVGRQRMEENAA